MDGQINLTMTDKTGGTSSLVMTAESNQHVVIEFTPDNTKYDKLTVSDPYQVNPTVTIEFEPHCTPDYPFYVRWINTKGGYDYFMFEQNKEFISESSDMITYKPFYDTTPEARSTRHVASLKGTNLVSVGAAQITEATFAMLSRIIYSPLIQMWDEDIEDWIEVTIDGTSARLSLNTSSALGVAEMTFNINDRNVQF